jgi:curli production assembly/transport component CsgF
MTLLRLALLALLLSAASEVRAQQFVYEPKNPAFGGFAANYQWLMQSAEAQKDYERERDLFSRDPLTDFQQSLQRQVLSALSRELVFNRFGDLDLSKGGRYDLGDFIIEITPGMNGVDISVMNVLTGDQTSILIPNP